MPDEPLPSGSPAPETPAAGGAPAGAPAAPAEGAGGAAPESEGIRQLRTQYETTRAQLEGYSRFGQPQEIERHVAIAQRITTEALEIGRELGYQDDDILASVANNPMAALEILRKEQTENRPAGDQDLGKLVQKAIDARLQPFEQDRNIALTNAANQRLEGEISRLIGDAYKGEDGQPVKLGAAETELIMAGAIEMFKYDEQAMKELKYGGQDGKPKVAAVAKYFNEVRKLWEKAYTERAAREAGRVGIPPGGPGGGKPPVVPKEERPKDILGDMAKNPEKYLGKKYAPTT